MTPCPACHNAVDPLRSRFVGVRDGKVVAYCSAECAAGRPGARPERIERAMSPSTGVPVPLPTPQAGMPPPPGLPGPPDGLGVGPVDSGPVIEILHEPTSGVVTSARDARGDARPRHPDEIPIAAFWAADKATKDRAAAARQGAAPATSDPRDASDPDPPFAPAAAAPPDAAAREHGGRDPADAADRSSAAESREPVETGREEAAARDAAEPSDAPRAMDRQDAAQRGPELDEPSGPDAGAARQESRTTHPVTFRPMGRESSVPVHAGVAAPDVDPPPRRRWPLIVLILVLLGAGGALLLHFFGRLSGGTGGHASSAPRAAPVVVAAAPAARAELSRPVRPPPVAAAPVVDPAASVELARSALRRDMAATSPRVQRLAAAALARTQDREACELLAAQIGLGAAGAPAVHAVADSDAPAGNDIARLDLAYALARGGDRRGAEVLARALGAPRGEARDEAAGLLALLGDRRAVPHLLDLLAVEQRRLGAAEHLARLDEPYALQVLDRVRGDARSSADDKARATVALGIAGHDAVAGALRDMLNDPHFNAFAAAALAAQGDRAARPVLEHQLASPPLRVLAARALRRLDPALDPRPLLPPLLDVVRAGRDIDRIPAAEAILLIAGPPAWSAFD
ncbi:MAG TPA: hypothetical protein VHW23_23025 [Kofleriaceae bacterium]|jgi:hypothetical protein|nr:hypothetical protein [Kofleriaceae bacterium]